MHLYLDLSFIMIFFMDKVLWTDLRQVENIQNFESLLPDCSLELVASIAYHYHLYNFAVRPLL